MIVLLSALFLGALVGEVYRLYTRTEVEPEWAGSWRSAPGARGTYLEMQLSGTGSAVAGTGVQHAGGGEGRPFVVHGTMARTGDLTVAYLDRRRSVERFTVTQPDDDHLVLSNGDRTLDFERVY